MVVYDSLQHFFRHHINNKTRQSTSSTSNRQNKFYQKERLQIHMALGVYIAFKYLLFLNKIKTITKLPNCIIVVYGVFSTLLYRELERTTQETYVV